MRNCGLASEFYNQSSGQSTDLKIGPCPYKQQSSINSFGAKKITLAKKKRDYIIWQVTSRKDQVHLELLTNYITTRIQLYPIAAYSISIFH